MDNPLYEYRAKLLIRLEAIVSEMADAIAAIPESRWHDLLPVNARSPHATLALLSTVEREAYTPRLRKLIAEETPTLEPFDSDRWLAEHYDATLPMTALLADYAGQREAQLQLLLALPPEGWVRLGRHLTFGVRSVQWWAERILEHSTISLRELRG